MPVQVRKGKALDIGQRVWIVDFITKKSTGKAVGATINSYRVVSSDDLMATVVRASRDDENANILDLVSLRFVKLSECWKSLEEAQRAYEYIPVVKEC